MPFKIVENDMTNMKTDAIVNAANSSLQRGSGVCGAIFAAAGIEALQNECDVLGGCKVGEAVITDGYDLHASKIIHTVGPIWKGGDYGEEELLYRAYKSSLQLALKNKLESISFPLISSGVYGYPKDKAFNIAISAIGDFLLEHEIDVYLVVYNKETVKLNENLFTKIEQYIDDNYIDPSDMIIESDEVQCLVSKFEEPEEFVELEDVIKEVRETFSEMLIRLIDEKGMTDVEAYKRANVDRRLFSKIRSRVDYSPSKVTAIAFAISLELNLDQTLDLLTRAGYALSPCNKFDIIIEFFIKQQNYNVYEINEALFSFDQQLLGV